jgi:hypothetical protein
VSDPGSGIEAFKAGAEAVTEVAKASRGWAGWVAQVLGDIPKDFLARYVGDRLREERIRNLKKLQAETEEFTAGIDEARKASASPNVGLLIMEAAMDESRDALQKLFASLLANAMVDGGDKVRVEYIQAVKQMHPYDAYVLKRMPFYPNLTKHPQHRPANWSAHDRDWLVAEAGQAGINSDDLSISLATLARLGCIHLPTGLFAYELGPFGRRLLAACTPPT